MALVYHYCSPQTFLQIIERKCIWLSSTNNMNDFAEGEWFAKELKVFLSEKKKEYGKGWCEAALNFYISNTQPKYIACFSKEKDTLSQWRAYAQDGEGVAIGFDDGGFGADGTHVHINTNVKKSLCLSDVNYYDGSQIKDELKRMAEKLRNGMTGIKSYAGGSAMAFALHCTSLALTIKNPAFKEENEKRLVYSAFIKNDECGALEVMNPISDISHRISNGYLTSYFELSFPDKGVIKEIVLGPKNKFHDIDMRNLLGLKKLGHVKFLRSAATYR